MSEVKLKANSQRRWLVAITAAMSILCCGCQTDALAISANIQARHLPFGTVLDPIFSSPASNDIVGYTRCGDSAIWTGHYLAAESFRYKVTGDPNALANARKALAGIQTLVDATGTGLLARCVVPMNSPYAAGITQEESHNGIHVSGQNYWIGNTSRDQYCGVFFGLSVAHEMVAQADVRQTIQSLVTRMLDFLISRAWTVIMPDGTPSTTFLGRADQQLSLLQVGRQVNSAAFAQQYDSNAVIGALLAAAPIALEARDVRNSYFKFNLDAIDLFDLIRLEDSASRRAQYRLAYGFLRDAMKNHMNAHFNMIDRALNGADPLRDVQTAAFLEEWLRRPRRDFFVDLRGEFSSCGDPAQSCDPIPVIRRVPTDFLWQRSPFQLVGGGSGLIESAGIDYILPYWMARFYGVVGS
jgi:hypothetical protein